MRALQQHRPRVVTAALMGDPTPDRLAIAEAIRLRLGDALVNDPAVPSKVLAVLEALSDGPMTLANLADEMGVSLSASHDRAQAALLLEMVERVGRFPYRFSLTDAGRDSLRAVS